MTAIYNSLPKWRSCNKIYDIWYIWLQRQTNLRSWRMKHLWDSGSQVHSTVMFKRVVQKCMTFSIRSSVGILCLLGIPRLLVHVLCYCAWQLHSESLACDQRFHALLKTQKTNIVIIIFFLKIILKKKKNLEAEAFWEQRRTVQLFKLFRGIILIKLCNETSSFYKSVSTFFQKHLKHLKILK